MVLYRRQKHKIFIEERATKWHINKSTQARIETFNLFLDYDSVNHQMRDIPPRVYKYESPHITSLFYDQLAIYTYTYKKNNIIYFTAFFISITIFQSLIPFEKTKEIFFSCLNGIDLFWMANTAKNVCVLIFII